MKWGNRMEDKDRKWKGGDGKNGREELGGMEGRKWEEWKGGDRRNGMNGMEEDGRNGREDGRNGREDGRNGREDIEGMEGRKGGK